MMADQTNNDTPNGEKPMTPCETVDQLPAPLNAKLFCSEDSVAGSEAGGTEQHPVFSSLLAQQREVEFSVGEDGCGGSDLPFPTALHVNVPRVLPMPSPTHAAPSPQNAGGRRRTVLLEEVNEISSRRKSGIDPALLSRSTSAKTSVVNTPRVAHPMATMDEGLALPLAIKKAIQDESPSHGISDESEDQNTTTGGGSNFHWNLDNMEMLFNSEDSVNAETASTFIRDGLRSGAQGGLAKGLTSGQASPSASFRRRSSAANSFHAGHRLSTSGTLSPCAMD